MKNKKSWLLPALLGVVGGIAGITSASAATIVSGDVILGFRAATGTTGADSTYLVNLGSASQFTGLNGTTTTLSLGIATDLAAQFGNNWATRTDLYWGVVGYVGGAELNPTLYASKVRSNVNIRTSAYDVLDRGSRIGTAGYNSTLVTGPGYGFQNLADTPNSTVQAVLQNSTTTGSYGSSTSGTNDFGSTSGWNIDGAIYKGSGNSVLDLYRLSGDFSDPENKATTYLGNFTINSSGVVSFNSFSAVPEPAAPLLGAMAMLLLVGSRRRRAH